MPHRIVLIALFATACFTGTLAHAQTGDLVAAAKRGDLDIVNRFLQAGADVNDRKFSGLGGDATALMEASNSGHLEVVQALLAAKADVNATLSEKKDGKTALTIAAQKGHVEVVRTLLAANAGVNHPCCGVSALHGEVNALYAAARAANLNMVKVLLTAKPDLNLQEKNGNTALMHVISTRTPDSPEIARLLIEAGARVNLSSNDGVTALTLAVQAKSLATVRALLVAGANVDFRWCSVPVSGRVLSPVPLGRANATALGIASSLGKADVVQALLSAKADVNPAQCDGKTPLTLALENDHQDVAELLRSAGAAVQ